MTFKSL